MHPLGQGVKELEMGGTCRRQTGLPNRPQIESISAGPHWDGIFILLGACSVMKTCQLHD